MIFSLLHPHGRLPWVLMLIFNSGTMKKTIITYFLLTFFWACDQNLDIEPSDALSPQIVLSDGDNLRNLLLGAYRFAGNELQGEVQVASELLANEGDLLYLGFYFVFSDFDAKQMNSSNSFIRLIWGNLYRSINLCNIVLDNLDLIEDDETRSLVEGEAKFLRGLAYFELVKLFALPYEPGGNNEQLGLPILYEGVIDASQISFPSRKSVEDVYNQIISDLNEAADLLPSDNFELADRYASLALLARVYMQQGNFQGALQASNEVLDDSGHALSGQLEGAFNNETDGIEDIFMWQVTTQDGQNLFNTYWATSEFGGLSTSAHIVILDPFFEIFEGPDDRSEFFYEGNETVVSSKWKAQFANVPYLRVAEMHLIRAECNFRLSSSTGLSALDDINTLRARSNAPPYSTLTLEDILLERKKELAFEGFALHEAKRLKRSIDGIPYDADRLVVPIPQDELDSNPNLEPNPGYSN